MDTPRKESCAEAETRDADTRQDNNPLPEVRHERPDEEMRGDEPDEPEPRRSADSTTVQSYDQEQKGLMTCFAASSIMSITLSARLATKAAETRECPE
jgi:hypothetical protein